jgi:hypothetical protein
MRYALFCLFAIFVLFASCFGGEGDLNRLVSKKFPHAEGVEIICWEVSEKSEGFTSQIVIFQNESNKPARILWQSALDSSYSPKIQFLDEITVSGLPIALVERQIGAAASQLDIIGKVSGRFQRLTQIDGCQFDIEHLDASKMPYIVAHDDENILDVPIIYRWRQNSFMEDSAAHPEYYRQLLVKDKAKLPSGTSAIVLVNLSRIAILSGDRAEAKTILTEALSRERSKGNEAGKYTLVRIKEVLQDLEHGSR